MIFILAKQSTSLNVTPAPKPRKFKKTSTAFLWKSRTLNPSLSPLISLILENLSTITDAIFVIRKLMFQRKRGFRKLLKCSLSTCKELFLIWIHSLTKRSPTSTRFLMSLISIPTLWNTMRRNKLEKEKFKNHQTTTMF